MALALTEDFAAFERLGVVMPPEDKDAAMLPHKIGDDGDTLHVHYGAADTCIGLATSKISELAAWLRETGTEWTEPAIW